MPEVVEVVAERPLSMNLANASPFGLKVARILDDIWALYNVPGLERIDFSRDSCVEVNVGKTLATFDFDELTQLVVRCHDACIRLSVCACNMRYLKLRFHPRERDGTSWARHPTMEQAVERVRARNYFTRRGE